MKMKIQILFMAGIMGLTVTACTNLDVDVNSQYTSYPLSEIALEGKMADIYYTFAGPLGRRYDEAQSLSSDEYVGESFDGNYVDDHNYSNMSLHNFTSTDAALGYYEILAGGITKANKIIADLGGNNNLKVVAPARAMRAFFHFILMDSYGDIPILDTIPADSEVIERQPRAAVTRFIVDELKDILPYLSSANDASTYGKPNRWMAEALLAKIYLNWPVYTAESVDQYNADNYTNDKLDSVVYYCDDIIKSGLFDLTSTQRSNPTNVYRTKFFPDNSNKVKDFIYAMPYDATTRSGMTYARFRTWKKANTGVSFFGWESGKSFGGVFAITPEMSSLFTLKGDDRNDVIMKDTIKVYDPSTYNVTDKKWTYNGNLEVIKKDITLKSMDQDLNVGEDANGYNQGYKSIKFYPSEDDYVNHDRNQSNDVPIFRFADILLEKCEAITRGARGTNGDTPESLFNQIRSYVHAPLLDHNPSLEEILDERGREFLDEHWRRNDMIRFGTWESEFGFHKKEILMAHFEKDRRIFPIPKSVLDNNSNWKQNKGYTE